MVVLLTVYHRQATSLQDFRIGDVMPSIQSLDVSNLSSVERDQASSDWQGCALLVSLYPRVSLLFLDFAH